MATYLTSREFNQETGRAKRVAEEGIVYITDRGEPTHVLMTIGEYRRLADKKKTIFDLLYMPGGEHIDLPLPEDELAQDVILD